MKPAPFAYHAPETLGEALEVLAGAGADGKVLAGGQSLIPLLNMRLAEPAAIVDVNRLPGLSGTSPGRVGALARHSAVARAGVHPLLTQALPYVAHPAIRNRGTVVGSLVHADPAAELPAVLAVLGGSVSARSLEGGEREIPAAELYVGPLESSLRPGELAVAATFPALPARGGTAFAEITRRHGDYALVGAAAVVELDEDLHVSAARIGFLGVADTPAVLDLTAALGSRTPQACDWGAAAALARERLEPDADIHATAEYRRHLAGVLTGRVLREAAVNAADAAAEGTDA